MGARFPYVTIAAVAATFCLVSCSGITVSQDYRPDSIAKMQAYRTYAWLPEPESRDPRIGSEILVSRVRLAVDTALAGKGLKLAEQDPEFLVGWHATVEQRVDVQTVDNYYGYRYGRHYGYGPGAGAWHHETYVDQYEEGMLLLDFVDAESNDLVWRGIAQARVQRDMDPERRQDRINTAVEKMLAKFPPQR